MHARSNHEEAGAITRPGQLRLRKVIVSEAVFATLPRDRVELAAAIGPGLVLEGLRMNGDQVEIFVHSETFDLEKCWCRAPVWDVPHLKASEAAGG